MLDRGAITTLLRGTAALDAFVVYGEPPAQLAGQAIVVVPRDPYQDHATFGTLTWYLGVAVMVPLAGGPAMDVVDATLAALRTVLDAQAGVVITTINVGRVDPVGGVEYIAAIVNIESS